MDNSVPEFLRSYSAYKYEYVRGLAKLKYLYNDPASRVLVVACDGYNADWRHFGWEEMEEAVRYCHREFARLNRFDTTMKMTAEDREIIEKLLSSGGFQSLRSEERKVGDFSVVYAPIRALRPGIAAEKIISRQTDYDPARDTLFMRESMVKTRFFIGNIVGVPVWVFYNKFPNLTGHSLFLPWPEKRLFHEMTREIHDWVWEAVGMIGQYTPTIAFGFNSIAGGATQKQFHLHVTVENPFPASINRVWTHNGGEKQYPAALVVSSDKEEAWDALDSCLRDDQIAYDLLYVPGKLYVFPGKPQGLCEIPWWASGIGLGERAGRITVSSREAYEQVRDDQIVSALEQWSGRT